MIAAWLAHVEPWSSACWSLRPHVPATGGAQQEINTALTGQGRQLDPVGRITTLGAFPTGGAISPDGRFYWAVDAGRGENFVRIIDMATGEISPDAALPGGYVGVASTPDGSRAYVSGLPTGAPAAGRKGAAGSDPRVLDRRATDKRPRSSRSRCRTRATAPPPRTSAAASNVKAWPEGLDVTPDGAFLVVALGQADQAAIIDLRDGSTSLADVGPLPVRRCGHPKRPRAYVTNERDGSVSVLDVPSGELIETIAVGGPRGTRTRTRRASPRTRRASGSTWRSPSATSSP